MKNNKIDCSATSVRSRSETSHNVKLLSQEHEQPITKDKSKPIQNISSHEVNSAFRNAQNAMPIHDQQEISERNERKTASNKKRTSCVAEK